MTERRLFNNLSRNVSDIPHVVELYDRLLWLRNHYDVGGAAEKERVLREIDETLYRFDGIEVRR